MDVSLSITGNCSYFCYAKTWYQELMAALQELEKATELCFKSRGKVIKVELEQICYVESHCSNTHAAVLWLMDKRPLQVPKNLRILEKKILVSGAVIRVISLTREMSIC